MQNIGGGLYEATIPGQSAGTTIIFKIRARDSVGNESVSSEYSYTVKARPSPQPSPSSPTRGIPLEYLAVAATAALVVMVILLVRRRRTS